MKTGATILGGILAATLIVGLGVTPVQAAVGDAVQVRGVELEYAESGGLELVFKLYNSTGGQKDFKAAIGLIGGDGVSPSAADNPFPECSAWKILIAGGNIPGLIGPIPVPGVGAQGGCSAVNISIAPQSEATVRVPVRLTNPENVPAAWPKFVAMPFAISGGGALLQPNGPVDKLVLAGVLCLKNAGNTMKDIKFGVTMPTKPKPTPGPTPNPKKELEIVKTDGDRALTRPGHDFAYKLTVRNTGEIDLHDVKVNDAVPSAFKITGVSDRGDYSGQDVSWNDVQLEAGAAKTFMIDVKVRENAGNGEVCNVGKVRSDDHDLSDEDDECITVERSPEVKAVVVVQPVAVPVTAKTGAGGAALVMTLLGAGGLGLRQYFS